MEDASESAGPGKVTLIGTGHVFRIEDTVRDAIIALRPDIVFIELDRGRLQGLLHRRQHGELPQSHGKGGFVHRRLHAFQQAIAKQYGGQVGEEMLAAVDGAQAVGARIALVDRPADATIKRAIKELTWKEKFRVVGQFLGGSAKAVLPGKRADMEDEVRRYQQDPQAALMELAKTFPTIHRVVIEERDHLMAGRIRHAMQACRHGVAVVGDGHVEGMQRILADLELESYRLGAVREGRLPKPVPGADASWSFTAGPPQP